MVDVERIRAATRSIRALHTMDDLHAIVCEETGELATELARLRRGRSTPESVCREAIDCIVVCLSLLDAYSASPVIVEEKMLQIEGYPARMQAGASRMLP